MPITPKVAALLGQVLPVLVLALVIDLRRVRQRYLLLRFIRFMGAMSGLGVTFICIEIAAFPDGWLPGLPVDIFVSITTLLVFVATAISMATLLLREEDKHDADRLKKDKHKRAGDHHADDKNRHK